MIFLINSLSLIKLPSHKLDCRKFSFGKRTFVTKTRDLSIIGDIDKVLDDFNYHIC